jgi:hypothetical protein
MNQFLKNNKHIPAFAAALAITLMIALVLLAIGVEAVFNSRLDAAQAAGNDPLQIDSAQIQDLHQLQELVAQYQQREQQYQAELQQAAVQLNQAEADRQQALNVLQELQSAGMITIGPDGQVTVNTSIGSGASQGWFEADHEHEEYEEHDD